MTILEAFVEISLSGSAYPVLFEDNEIWELEAGAYRAYFGAHPVLQFGMRTAKGDARGQSFSVIQKEVITEFSRHACVLDEGEAGCFRGFGVLCDSRSLGVGLIPC